MEDSSGYGERFGERLRAKATAFVWRSLRNTSIAVTELRSDNPEHGISAPLVREDAYLVGYQIVDYPVHEYFEDERAAPVASLRAGQTNLYDLKRSPQFNITRRATAFVSTFPALRSTSSLTAQRRGVSASLDISPVSAAMIPSCAR
jgi:AraC family transcriptional regulator